MEWALIKQKLKILVISLLFVLIFICLVLPLFILRYCVNILSKLLRPDLDCMTTRIDTLFCKDYENWHVCPGVTITMCFYMDKSFSFEKCRTRANAMVTHEYKYRKLRQCIEKWLGFLFWKNDESFRIEDHVKIYPGEEEGKTIRDKKWVNETMQSVMFRPYIKDKSPWEVLWIPRFKYDLNDEKEYSAAFLNLHHSIGDGLMAMRLLESFSGSVEKIQPNFPNLKFTNSFTKLIYFSLMLLKTPYTFAEMSLTRQDKIKVPWNCDNYKFQYKSSYAEAKRIPLNYLKTIKNKYNVNFNSVLLFGVSSLIRNAYIKAKIKLPDVVHCLLPLPMPNHPDELSNYLTTVNFRFPIGISDPVMRLKIIEEEMVTLKSSLHPQVNFLMSSVIGSLPFNLLKQLKVLTPLTGNVVIAPVAIEIPPFLHRVVFSLAVPALYVSSGFLISCSTHNSVLDIGTNFDKSIFETNEQVEQLYEFMYQDYKQLSGLEIEFIADGILPFF